MIEAMACGTPVIAWRRGSVPETIEHGVTGFIVENEAEAIDAIERVPTLDRRRVRAAFERRFTARRMAESYRRCFEKLAARGGSKATASGSRSSRDSATGMAASSWRG
jgi:glycosyltransferase involved in cell wall biosynthesis